MSPSACTRCMSGSYICQGNTEVYLVSYKGRKLHLLLLGCQPTLVAAAAAFVASSVAVNGPAAG